MRVLQVAWEYPPRLFGGLGRHLEGMVGALLDTGAQVTVLTPHLAEGLHDEPVEGLRVLRTPRPEVALPSGSWVADVLDANVAMAHTGLSAGIVADVLHVHDWMAGHAARILAPALDLPVVATIHATERGRHQGHVPAGLSTWIDAQERALVTRADEVVVCAPDMAEQVTESLGARQPQVIPNGVIPSAWTVDVARREDLIVYAGRLEYEKGVQVLIAATEGLGVEVRIAGRGSHGPALRRQAHADVRWAGRLDQPALAELLAEATLVVVPSLYEPFGLVALEAMAAGAPVVASNVGGLRQLVDHRTGVLVAPDDVVALRTAIEELLADPDRRAALSRAGRRRARELSWDRTAADYRALYEKLARW